MILDNYGLVLVESVSPNLSINFRTN